jgi:hypothetical protein
LIHTLHFRGFLKKKGLRREAFPESGTSGKKVCWEKSSIGRSKIGIIDGKCPANVSST